MYIVYSIYIIYMYIYSIVYSIVYSIYRVYLLLITKYSVVVNESTMSVIA